MSVREPLAAVFHLVDARHQVTPTDLQVLTYATVLYTCGYMSVYTTCREDAYLIFMHAWCLPPLFLYE